MYRLQVLIAWGWRGLGDAIGGNTSKAAKHRLGQRTLGESFSKAARYLTSDLEGLSAYSDGARIFVRATCSGPKTIRGS